MRFLFHHTRSHVISGGPAFYDVKIHQWVKVVIA